MQLVVEEGVAAGEAEVVVLAVLLLRDARGVFRLDPFELAVQHEVDDARDGVGTIGRRGAAGDDVDALDERRREVVDVDAAVGVSRGHARAVQQHECAVQAHAAQIQVRAAGGRADGVAASLRGRRREELRQLIELFRNRRAWIELVELGHRHHGDRRRCRHAARLANSATGDDDFFVGLRCGLVLVLVLACLGRPRQCRWSLWRIAQ